MGGGTLRGGDVAKVEGASVVPILCVAALVGGELVTCSRNTIDVATTGVLHSNAAEGRNASVIEGLPEMDAPDLVAPVI